jgi:hypothetical protein
METRHIGRIVTGCLVGGLVVALALVLGPVAGAQEHVITGTILLAFAASWAFLGTLSMLRTEQPQRWAFEVASFMALAGTALLVLAPSGAAMDALGWVWPPLFLALLAGTIVRVHRDLHSRSASYYALFAAMSGSIQTVVLESTLMTVFVIAAVAGFEGSAWIIVGSLAAHGLRSPFTATSSRTLVRRPDGRHSVWRMTSEPLALSSGS